MTETEKQQIEQELKHLETGMSAVAFPVNPIPFANGLANGVRLYGTDWIQSDQAQKILFVLMGQSYGQFAEINLNDEYIRLID